MVTEAKTRKNIDYSASAVNLTNDYHLVDLMRRLGDHEQKLHALQNTAQSLIPDDLKESIRCTEEMVKNFYDDVRQAIGEFGSYQDVEHGVYALKQRKVSVSYDAARFEYLYPQYAPAIIVKAVDAAKLKGLIKGGLLNEEDLKHPDVGIVKETESFAYVIRG